MTTNESSQTALPDQPDERPRSGARDVAWLAIAALLATLFIVDLVENVIAIAQQEWSVLPGAPFALLFFWWAARGAWRRTSWGRQRRQAKDVARTTQSIWRVDWRSFTLFLPNGSETYMRRDGADLRIALRSIVVVFSGALLFLAGFLATFPDLPNGSVMPWLALLGVIAAAALNTARLLTHQPLDCSSDDALAAAYVPVVCIRLALSESVALFALTFTFLGGPAWIYYVGAPCSLIWLWVDVAPTRRTLAHDQRRMAAQGCDRSLLEALGPRPRPAA